MQSISEPGVEIPPTIFKIVNIAASAAETTVWTPTVGKRFRLLLYALFSNTAAVLTFRDNTAGPTILQDGVAANTRCAQDLGGKGLLSATVGNVLTLQASAASTINGFVAGIEENPPFTYPKT